jgi:hypothetical protein
VTIEGKGNELIREAHASLDASMELGTSGDVDRGVAALDAFVARFEASPDAEIRRLVACARYNAGGILKSAGRVAEALPRWRLLLDRCREDPDEEVRFWGAYAAYNSILGHWHSPSPAATDLERVVKLAAEFDALSAAAHHPQVHVRLARAWRLAVTALVILGRPDQAAQAARALAERYRHVEPAEIAAEIGPEVAAAVDLARSAVAAPPPELHITAESGLLDALSYVVYDTARAGAVAAAVAIAAVGAATAAMADWVWRPVAVVAAGGLGIAAVYAGRRARAAWSYVPVAYRQFTAELQAHAEKDHSARRAVAAAALRLTPLVLYLRGFAAEGSLSGVFETPTGLRRINSGSLNVESCERLIAEAVDGAAVALSVANPADPFVAVGKGRPLPRLQLPFEGWEEVVQSLALLADVVVMDVTTATRGVLTELELLVRLGRAADTVVLFHSEPESRLEHHVLRAFGAEGLVRPPLDLSAALAHFPRVTEVGSVPQSASELEAIRWVRETVYAAAASPPEEREARRATRLGEEASEVYRVVRSLLPGMAPVVVPDRGIGPSQFARLALWIMCQPWRRQLDHQPTRQ